MEHPVSTTNFTISKKFQLQNVLKGDASPVMAKHKICMKKLKYVYFAFVCFPPVAALMHFSFLLQFQGRTMVGQNVLMELLEGDKVQLYVYTSAGISDHKTSHYTQFIGCLLRPSVETLAAVMRKLGSTDGLDDDVSLGW